jgi:hypothetical protein
MKIEFDFRADMTVCELIQYLCDELQNEARHTDSVINNGEFRSESKAWKIEGCISRENRICDLIDDITLWSNKASRISEV